LMLMKMMAHPLSISLSFFFKTTSLSQQTTSHFLPRPLLLCLRALELAFFVTVVACDGTTGDRFGTEHPWPAFFTSWCFVLFGAWALAGTALTACDLWRDSKGPNGGDKDGEEAKEDKVVEQTVHEEEEEEEDEEEWRARGSSEEGATAASAAACSSAPATPQRAQGGRNPRTTTGGSEDLEAAAESKSKRKILAAAPSPSPSSVSNSSSVDSRRPLTAPPRTLTTPSPTTSTSTKKDKRKRGLPPSNHQPLPLPPLPMDLPHKLYSLLSSVTGPAAIFVAAMYWMVLRRFIALANPEKPFDPVDAMLHGGNALFVVLDVLLSRTPAASSHFQITLAYGTAYSIFIWSYERVTGELLYGRILAWSRPTALGFYGFALPGSLLACFVLWCLLAAGREKVGMKMIKRREEAKAGQKQRGERKGNGAGDDIDNEQEKRTKERTLRWTEENCASLPSLSTSTKDASSPSSLV